jgi:hypothetical protein
MRTREWSHPGRWLMDGDPGGDQSNALALIQHGGRIGELITEHIATHSPRDVLAQCEAHTAILDRYERARDAGQRGLYTEWEQAQVEALEFAVDAVALAYQHRPGYQEAWR